MAIGILSGASTCRIVEMIESGDVRALTQLPKVGKKKAEQMVLALRGQMVIEQVIEPESQWSQRDHFGIDSLRVSQP